MTSTGDEGQQQNKKKKLCKLSLTEHIVCDSFCKSHHCELQIFIPYTSLRL